MNSGLFSGVVLSVGLLAASQAGYGQTTAPQPPAFPYEILFSIVTPYRFDGGVVQDGDVASSRGVVAARNAQLLKQFGPPQTTDAAGNIVPVDYGLDALFELRLYPAAATFRPQRLFSVKTGFHSSTLNVDISDGDLLSDAGVVVATNAQLLANFKAPGDMGLDAVYIPYYVPMAANPLPPEIWFSTNKGWYDAKLGHYISDGDLLSSRGYVVATNQQLLRNFLTYPDIALDPTQPPVMDMGLDAAQVIRFRPWAVDALTSALPTAPEIWFSVNKDFTDKWGRSITNGDLLSTSGAIVRRNRELLANFPPSPLMGPTGMPVLLDYGLDAVYVRGRTLIGGTPTGPTVPKVSGNVIRLVFDGPVSLPGSTALSVGSQTAPQGSGGTVDLASSTFGVSVGTTNVAGDTLVLAEQGAALSSSGPYTVQPSDALDVEPFMLTVTKLVGDIVSDGYVNVGDLQQLVGTWGGQQGSAGYNDNADLNGDGYVNVGDLQLLVANWGRSL